GNVTGTWSPVLRSCRISILLVHRVLPPVTKHGSKPGSKPRISTALFAVSLVLFRHGDRTPFDTFPTDLHGEDDWPQGFGQMTKLGLQQQYELGKYLRNRYKNFLNATYVRKEIYILSTDYDRTIMSAQATLASLFPPTGSQIWNPKILWQPIPVHVVPQSLDQIHFPIRNCPRYLQLQEETKTSKEYNKLLHPHLKIHNYTRPKWASDYLMHKMEKLAALTMRVFFEVYKKEEKSRLQGGVILKAMLEHIQNATRTHKRKMMVYSAHGTTIAGLQIALNIYNGNPPPYASCHFIELYEEPSGQYSIGMYYRNDTSKDPYKLTLPGCTHPYPLKKFVQLVSPIIPDDWEKECGIRGTMKGNETVL
uniref:acid phosphatase n=1 Tax=Sphenodon punctatus TaxID=8508 RepID=A0A8D0GB59_SPHPU